jgi:LacI family transcriptional regulator
MREMNYHPSAVARGLSSKKVHTLGVLFGAVDSIEFATNSYVSGLLQGIMQHAQREGFDITFFTANWKDAATSAPPLRDGRTDGVLTISPQLTSDIISGVTELHVPLVAISAGDGVPVDNVDVDNFAGLKMATEHLLALGHRRIAFLSGDDDMASYEPRRQGFFAALAGAGIEAAPELVQKSRFDGSLAVKQARALLSLPHPPTAICCGNDHIALGVLEAARAMSVSVPAQLSIVGFDDIPATTFAIPQLTTIRQPLREMGQFATRMLIERLRAPGSTPTTRLFQPELIVRGTTAPAPSNSLS